MQCCLGFVTVMRSLSVAECLSDVTDVTASGNTAGDGRALMHRSPAGVTLHSHLQLWHAGRTHITSSFGWWKARQLEKTSSMSASTAAQDLYGTAAQPCR